MAEKERIPEHLKPWIEARRRFRLSHMHIQMARELGMNPKKLGKLANHHQEPSKAPLPIFIEDIYFKRFGKYKPDEVRTIKEVVAAQLAKKQARKLAKQARKAERMAAGPDGPPKTPNVAAAHAPVRMQASDLDSLLPS